MNSVLNMREHRNKHNLDIPDECKGFRLDDHVKYQENGEERKGYILCFRRFDYNWFAWIYFDKNTFKPEDCIYVGELSKIEEE